jgi:hypothetical protein
MPILLFINHRRVLVNVDQLLLPCDLVHAAVFFHAQRSRRPPRLPRYMQLQFQPLQLQRFLRSCVLATAHALKRRRICGCDERRCWGFGRAADCRRFSCSRVACAQAAAATRVAGKDGIRNAAEQGDVAAVQDYLIADSGTDGLQVRLDAAQRCMHSDICF